MIGSAFQTKGFCGPGSIGAGRTRKFLYLVKGYDVGVGVCVCVCVCVVAYAVVFVGTWFKATLLSDPSMSALAYPLG